MKRTGVRAAFFNVAYGAADLRELFLMREALLRWYRPAQSEISWSGEPWGWMSPEQRERHRVIWDAGQQDHVTLSQLSAICGENWQVAGTMAEMACEEAGPGTHMTPALAICLLLSVDRAARQGDYEEGKRRLARATDGLWQLTSRERLDLCRYFEPEFGRLLRQSGWEREADAWAHTVSQAQLEQE